MLTGLAFATPTAAWAVTLEHETSMNYPIRFGAIPLMLFSGTFFPISQLPGWIRPLAYATPLWHGVALCRALSLGDADPGSVAIHVGYLVALAAIGLVVGRPDLPQAPLCLTGRVPGWRRWRRAWRQPRHIHARPGEGIGRGP